MSQFTRMLMVLTCLSMLAATGCGEKEPVTPRDDQEAARAADEIARLQADLDRARADRAGLEDEILRLKDALEDAQQQLEELAKEGPVWTNVPGGKMTSIEGTILFDSGEAKLRDEARNVLRNVAADINNDFPDYDIYVFGHTDNEPIQVSGWDDNYQLSCERALSVVRHLQSLGCQKNMLAGGWGENVPAASNATAAGRQQNRRVEIYAIMTKAALGQQ